MATIIDLTDEFPSKNISTSPYWILGVIRLKHPVTYSRANGKSISVLPGDGADIRDENLVITHECINLHVSRQKSNHIKTLSATLKKSDKEFLTEILPGDWIFAWIVNSDDEGRKLAQRIRDGEACNKKADGLKFIGRVASVFKNLDKSATHAITYNLSAYGFRELETQLFYDPMLAQNDLIGTNVATWMCKLGFDFEKMFKPILNSMFDDNIIEVLSAYIELLLGKGAPDSEVNPTGQKDLQASHGQTTGGPESPPYPYVVPPEVGKWIGKDSRGGSGEIMAYADVIDLLFGIQEYDNNANYPKVNKRLGAVKVASKPLLGAILPVQASFTNRPLWSLLQQYSNLALNEIYTCLKADEEGNVVPTLVARQKPFSTDALNQKSSQTTTSTAGGIAAVFEDIAVGDLPFTKFTDLPRWKIEPHMVESYSIGRGEASRCNLVKVTGTAQHVTQIITPIQQIVDNPPPSDDIDIQRSGIYSYIQSADVTEGSQIGTIPGKFMRLIADWSMGNHLSLQGSMETIGISSPICEGDNITYNGIVFHIESIDFACSISGGHKTFRTRLSLSNGMLPGTIKSKNDGDMPIYPGLPPQFDNNTNSLEEEPKDRAGAEKTIPGVSSTE
jgi:hypothetical protein